ncbi:calcium-binding protein [Phormidesmis sp. 146-33]
MSNSSLLILLASDVLVCLYIDDDPRLGQKRQSQCQRLLPKFHQYRHINTLTVTPATLNYFLSSLDEDRIQQIKEAMEEDGIAIPQDYAFSRVEIDQPESLYKAELEDAIDAIADQLSVFITYNSLRYIEHLSYGALYIWNIESIEGLFERLSLEHNYQLSPTPVETHSQVDQPSAQSEDETRREVIPSRLRRLVIHMLITVLGSQLLQRDDRSSSSQPSRQTPGKPTFGEVPQERRAIEFHAPTTSQLGSNAALNANENIIKQAIVDKLISANGKGLNQALNRGVQFSGLGLASQILTNYDRSDASSKTIQESSAPIPSSSAQNYNLIALSNAQNTSLQRSGSSDRASPEFFELKSDRSVSIPTSFTLTSRNFDNPNVTDFDVALLLRLNPPAETPQLPSSPFNQTEPVSQIKPIINLTPPNDRPSPEIDKPTPQEPEKLNSTVPPDLIVASPQILDGAGGIRSFTLTEGRYEVRNFGGVGISRVFSKVLSEDIIPEVDTLQFQGSQLIAKNLLLDQQGADLIMTFEGVQTTSILIKNFNLENLDNFLTLSDSPTLSAPPILLGNIQFNGESSIQDSFDVINADAIITEVFNRNSVTFLNNLDNEVKGLDDSNDVMNGQGGNDFLQGLGGDDILRGGAGDDILWGGTGADILDGGTGNNELTGGDGADVFRLCRGGFSEVTDFQAGIDRIGLPADIQLSEVAIEQGTGLNSSSTLIRFKPDGSLLMSLSGIAASSLTTDIFLPNASSLMRE